MLRKLKKQAKKDWQKMQSSPPSEYLRELPAQLRRITGAALIKVKKW